MKRPRECDEPDKRPSKLIRVLARDRLSNLSDELLLRILSFVPVATLNICQRYGNLRISAGYRLTGEGFPIGCMRLQSIPNYGKQRTITVLFAREPLKFPAPPPTICAIRQNYPNGLMKLTWSKVGKIRTGRDNTNSVTTGQGGSVRSVRYRSPKNPQYHRY